MTVNKSTSTFKIRVLDRAETDWMSFYERFLSRHLIIRVGVFVDVGGGADGVMRQVVIGDISAVTTARLGARRAVGFGHTRLPAGVRAAHHAKRIVKDGS